MVEQIRIVIADDHPLFRDGVSHTLGAEPDMAVVGQAASGEEALLMARQLLPDVLLLDIQMPGQGGLAAAAGIAAACPAVRIVILTVSEHEDDLLAAFKAGARGYVLKGASAMELARVIRTVASGDVYVSPTLAASMLVELTRGNSPEPWSELTEREQEILHLLSEGLTNRAIGERVHLAEKTVKHYVTNILAKLHVRSRVEAALLAAQHKKRE